MGKEKKVLQKGMTYVMTVSAKRADLDNNGIGDFVVEVKTTADGDVTQEAKLTWMNQLPQALDGLEAALSSVGFKDGATITVKGFGKVVKEWEKLVKAFDHIIFLGKMGASMLNEKAE